jgi:hypothetical protein
MIGIKPLIQSTIPLFIRKFFVHLERVFIPSAQIVRWDFNFNRISDDLRKFEMFKIVEHGDRGSLDIIRSPAKDHVWLERILFVRILTSECWQLILE